ncbi:MAG: hypothetical protein AAFN92_03325, partial [Bacteroidota bacterium]
GFFHLFTVIEFALLLTIYHQAWFGKRLPRLRWGLFAPLLALACGDAFGWGSLQQFNVYARLYENVVLVLLAGIFFYRGLTQSNISENPFRSNFFWINTAVLLYFSASFFVVLFSAAWIDRNAYGFTIFSAHALLVIIKNSLFALALWTKPTSSKSPVSSP